MDFFFKNRLIINKAYVMAALHQSILYGKMSSAPDILSDFKSCRRVLLLYSPLTCTASWNFSDGSEDPATTPFLDIADQKGNPIYIPTHEKKVTESQLCCVLCGALKILLAILLLTRKDCKVLPGNCLNSAVIYTGSVTSARTSWNPIL